MIPVCMVPEPPAFDRVVRQKGLAAIAEMVGRDSPKPRSGPRRKPRARSEAEIPSDNFPPYWRDALDLLLDAYERRCAFLALYLEHATGNPSVDHMLPKSRRWDQVYEWKNYRLCAATINGRKSDLTGLVDPVECRSGWFALELVGFQVIRGSEAPSELEAQINATLDLVNAPDCCKAREEYVNCYLGRQITYEYLSRRAPFVAHQLRRLGRLHPGD
jgi:hypothetical protein